MTISKVPDDLTSSESLGKVSRTAARSRKGRAAQAEHARDKVDVSKLGGILARHVANLADETKVRAEKIAAFKDKLDTPPDLPDTVVDEILRRATSV
ncbi:MAG: hypothetical protein JXR37_37910 [Kiritimatiellae bacterium]|nr:hypothetical protein [Kiritimatiellia bacterium]